MKFWLSREPQGLFLKAWTEDALTFDRRKKKAFGNWSEIDLHGRILAFKPTGEDSWSLEDGSIFSASGDGDVEELTENQAVEILSTCKKFYLYSQFKESWGFNGKED